MNKYTLGTISGVVLIGVLRSKLGSHIRLNLKKHRKTKSFISFGSKSAYPENLSNSIEEALDRYLINKPNLKAYIYREWQEDVEDHRIQIRLEYICNDQTVTENNIWTYVEDESWKVHDFLLDKVFSPLNIYLKESNVEYEPIRQEDVLYNVDTGEPYQAPLKANTIKLRKR